MVTENEVYNFNNETKSYWNITNFKEEILDWKFVNNEHTRIMYNIGHPTNSHKGTSVGDILPYTQLPRLLKEKYPTCQVKVPEWFWEFFKNNPFVDGIDNNLQRWGSLGTWGTTVQRTCNVWGIQTFEFRPKIYHHREIYRDSILICTNSKTGGRVKDIKQFEDIVEELKTKYYCVQMGLEGDQFIRNANEYLFNISRENLTHIVGQHSYYIGVQNSIYHLSKALGLKVIGLLPENVDPFFIMLPLLTQVNYLELEMLPLEQRFRSELWKNKVRNLGKNPDESHHCGWLYPDSSHLTLSFQRETTRCPSATPSNVMLALEDKIYPYNDSRLWDVDIHRNYWI